jgi:hypothetical protein
MQISKALTIIEEFLRENAVGSVNEPDGIYYSVQHKREIVDKFDEVKQFIVKNI